MLKNFLGSEFDGKRLGLFAESLNSGIFEILQRSNRLLTLAIVELDTKTGEGHYFEVVAIPGQSNLVRTRSKVCRIAMVRGVTIRSLKLSVSIRTWKSLFLYTMV